jgi:hypothetical protein
MKKIETYEHLRLTWKHLNLDRFCPQSPKHWYGEILGTNVPYLFIIIYNSSLRVTDLQVKARVAHLSAVKVFAINSHNLQV